MKKTTRLHRLFAAALFALMLLFAFSVSSSVVQRTARQQLADTVRAHLDLDAVYRAMEEFSHGAD